ncbi:hypothetical protein LB504_011302 [Fusarium proliferatum]|nr:hypothetical protein LB504_011302 [Fusarium proliferatum]
MALREGIEIILMNVEVFKLQPEACPGNDGEDCDDTVVPNKKRIGRKTNESLTEGSREGCHEKSHGLDHGPHISPEAYMPHSDFW